jgi:hypothetical protein
MTNQKKNTRIDKELDKSQTTMAQATSRTTYVNLQTQNQARSPSRSLKKRRRQQDDPIIAEHNWISEEEEVESESELNNPNTDQMSINLLHALIPGLPLNLEISPAEVKAVLNSPKMLQMMQEAGRHRIQDQADKAERELQNQMSQMNLQVQLAVLANKKLDSQVLIENAKAVNQKHAWHGGYYS